jgi:hypothetical protein
MDPLEDEMPLVSVAFRFRQRFPFPVQRVYDWATDFAPGDLELMGVRGQRRIARVCNDTVVLTDTRVSDGKRVTKQRLVRLYPERLAWTNTHLSGPNKHSQFLYELVATGKSTSRLDFTGRQVMHVEKAAPKDLRALSAKLGREDAETWKKLARALAADLR